MILPFMIFFSVFFTPFLTNKPFFHNKVLSAKHQFTTLTEKDVFKSKGNSYNDPIDAYVMLH